MQFSKSFIRFNWVLVVLLYLVVVAGSFVRITGSGMGCPDWPKCFGSWVPPTQARQLPQDYKAIYLAKRTKKVEKYSKFLVAIGMEETAERIKNDPSIYKDEPFNVKRTWTEYLNRLVGFLAGNLMLFGFGWMLLRYRKSKLIWLLALNLILMGFEGWFGSLVVASNLVPWTITIHLLIALIIIGVQLYITYKINEPKSKEIKASSVIRSIIWIVFIITFYQMILGTQVREAIDQLTKQGIGRDQWTDKLGMPFYIHRSFSWLVLVAMVYLTWKNEKGEKIKLIRLALLILVIELISGVLLAYADMPGLVQTSHLVFASILFGILWMGALRLKK